MRNKNLYAYKDISILACALRHNIVVWSRGITASVRSGYDTYELQRYRGVLLQYCT